MFFSLMNKDNSSKIVIFEYFFFNEFSGFMIMNSLGVNNNRQKIIDTIIKAMLRYSDIFMMDNMRSLNNT